MGKKIDCLLSESNASSVAGVRSKRAAEEDRLRERQLPESLDGIRFCKTIIFFSNFSSPDFPGQPIQN